MSHKRIKYLDIDDNFYIENNIVKVKINESNERFDFDCSIDDIWNDVKRIILKAKEYDENQSKQTDRQSVD